MWITGGMQRVSQCLVIAVLAGTVVGKRLTAPSFGAASANGERQLVMRGIHDQRVLAAMAKVPREELSPRLARCDL